MRTVVKNWSVGGNWTIVLVTIAAFVFGTASTALAQSPPNIVLNGPADGAEITEGLPVQIDATVTDPEASALEVWIYGDQTATPTTLLYNESGLASPADVLYTWQSTGREFSVTSKTTALWHLNENTGTTAGDATTNHDGTIVGASWATGRFGSALDFDGGTTTYARIPDSDDWDTPNITIQGWINPESWPGSPTSYFSMLTKGTGGASWDLGYAVLMNGDGELTFCIGNAPGGWGTINDARTATTMTTSTWTHIAITYDGSHIRLYVNGDLDSNGTANPFAYGAGMRYADGPIDIGASFQRGATDSWDGLIDEVAIYDQALTAAEIKQIYTLEAGRYYWYLQAEDADTDDSTTLTRYFDIVPDEPPDVTLDAPSDGAQFVEGTNVDLEVTSDDPEGGPVDVWIYGDTSATPTTLLHTETGVASPADVLYTWGGGSSPVEFGVTTDTKALWHFNENTGTTAGDETTNHDGTISGPDWITGRFGSALDFNGGENDRVQIPDSDDWDTPEITVEAWVYATSFNSTYNCILTKGTYPGTPTYDLGHGLMTFNSQLEFLIGTSDGQGWAVNHAAVGGTSLSVDTWYHVAATYDGSLVRLYVNGVLDSNGTSNPYAFTGGLHYSDGPVDIGASLQQTTSDSWDGMIDEMRVSDRALTESEINEIYRLGVDRYYWYAVSADTSGNDSTTLTRYFDINPNQPPDLTLNAPGDGAQLAYGETIGLDVSADDPEGGDVDVSLYGDQTATPTTLLYNQSGLASPADVTHVWYGAAHEFSITDKTVGLWHLNENTGTTAGDAMGTHDGTITGATWTTGQFGSALSFSNTVETRVQFPDSDDWDTPNVTMQAWVNPSSLPGGYNAVLCKGTLPDGFVPMDLGYALLVTSGGIVDVAIGNSDGSGWAVIGGALSSTTVATGTWTHIAATYDGSYVRIYINGDLDSNGAANPYALSGTMNDAEGPIDIGSSFQRASDDSWNGLIDEVAIYGEALSAEEIKEAYALQAGTYYWYSEASDDVGNDSTALTRTFDVLAPPVAPTLSGPADLDLINDATPTFDWSATAGTGVTYTLQYSTDGSFATGVVTESGLTTNTFTVASALSDGDFYWRVGAFNSAGIGSGYQTAFSFTLDATPPALPGLTNPPDLTLTNNNTPTFDWDATAGVGGTYTLQYALNEGFTTGLVTESGLSTNTFTVASALADATYFWRVEAIDAALNGSGYQVDPFEFTIDATPPAVPGLTSPADLALINDDTPTFDWSATGDTYTLQYATNEAFTAGLVTESGLTTNTFTVASALTDATYYWRVEAFDAALNGSGYQIDPYEFTVDVTPPALPDLTNPADLALINDATPTFDWSATGDTYTLQYATNEAFTAGLVTESGLTTNTFTVASALTDATYYWRVEAFDAATNGSGYQVDPYEFTVDATPPGVPVLNNPTDLLVTNDDTPTFDWSATGDTYTLQYATNEAFTAGLVTELGLTTNTFTVASALAEDTYYWRVEAFDAATNGSGYQGDPYEFTVDVTAPSIPTLTNPADLAVITDNTPTFDWGATGDTYTLQYATDESFSTDLVTESGLTANTHTVTSPLANDTWYWRVEAFDAATNGSGYQADPFEFTVTTANAPTITLNSPANGASTLDLYMPLDVTVDDDLSDPILVRMYGGTASPPTDLIYEEDVPLSSPTGIVHNWGEAEFEVRPSTVGLWHSNEGTGGTTADASGNGNTGTISGALWTTGKFGQALDFDGADDYVEIADSPELRLTGGFTVEAWVYAQAWPSGVMVIARKGSPNMNYLLRKDDANLPSFQVHSTTTTSNYALGSATDWGPNAWYHVAGVWEGDSIKIYVNGVLAGEDAASGTPLTDATVLHIGDNSLGGAQWNGLIDEVRISDRALTATEIAASYALAEDRYYWQVYASDGTNEDYSEIRYFDKTVPVNDPPVVTLVSPLEGASTEDPFMDLSADVDDPEGDLMTVWVYGDAVDASDLLYVESGVTDPSTINYSWTATVLPVETGVTTGLWHFDDGTGSTTADATTNGNDGTIVGATWSESGRFGYALDFDGTDDYVEIADSPELRLTSDFTVETWVNGSSWPSGVMVILRKGSSDSINYLLRKDGDGLPSFQVKSTTSDSNFALGSATDWGAGAWHYLAGTWESDSIKLYIDGVLVGAGAASGIPLTDDVPLHIGDNTAGSAEWFGLIDEVRISPRALTASEVEDNYKLAADTYSWKVEADDGNSSTVSATRTFDILPETNFAPAVALQSPPDDSSTADRQMLLQAGVDDLEGDLLTVSFYGDQNPSPTTLLHQEFGVTVPSAVSYDWIGNPVEFAVTGGTVGLWHMNENTGATAADASSYGHDGTITGATWTTGRFGSALDFDGTGDYVHVAHTSDLAIAGPYTIEAWVNPRSLNSGASGYNVICRKGADAAVNFILRNHDSSPSVEVHTDVDSYEAIGSASDWTLGTWAYLAGVWDGSYIRLYVNGTLVDSTAGSGTSLTDTEIFSIGDKPAGGAEWDGLIDEVRVTSGALTSAQIASTYQLDYGTYYWQVTASDDDSTTTSGVRAFHLVAPPAVPTLTNPADLATIATATPTFDWSATAGTGGTYTLEYAEDASFTTGLVTVSALATNTYTVPSALAENTYYWHVEAINSVGGGSGYQTTPFSFTVDVSGPAVPTLTNPADLAVTNNSTPTFDWTATAGTGGTYTFEYATDAIFTSDVVTVTGIATNTYTPPSAIADNTYYWHVEAFDAVSNGSGYQTVPFQLTVDVVAPAEPTLTNPADLAVINNDTPTFDWSATAGTGGTYTLEYATDLSFTTDLVTVTGLATNTHTVPGALADDTYYWHVEAFDAASNGSGYQADPFEFTIDTQAPTLPTLTNPADLALITNDTPTFDWSATGGTGGTYTLEYATDLSFTTDLVTVTGLTTNTHTVPGALADNTYYWHVEAFDAASNGSGYQVDPFEFTLDATAPDVPTLINPPDLTVTSDDTPTFDWDATAGTGGTYTLQYATNESFTTGLVTESGLTTATFTVASALADDTYYWRVEAIDAASNASGYPVDPFEFTVDTQAPTAPTLINPADLAVVNDNTPTYDWSATAGTGGTYTLQYATNASFTTGVVTVTDLTDTTYTTAMTDGTYFWHVEAFDAASNGSGYQGTPFSFTVITVVNTPPVVVLDAPADGAVLAQDYADLLATVTDADGDPMTVWIYGGTTPAATDLLHVETGVLTGTQVSYSWQAPTLQVTADTRGLWHLNENTGTTVADASGNGNTGTLNGPTWSTAGQFGSGLFYDGDPSDNLNVGNDPSLNPTTELTYEAWVYVDQITGLGNKWFTRDSCGSMRVMDNGALRFEVMRAGSAYIWPSADTPPGSMPLDEWVYVAGTCDATGALKAYINGRQLGTGSLGGGMGTSSEPMYIGWWPSFAMDGMMDEVRISSRALSSAEIFANARLVNGTYYWRVEVSDGIDTDTSETRSFDIDVQDNNPPVITMNAPDNGASYPLDSPVALDVAVVDAEVSPVEVWIYGDTNPSPTTLLYHGVDLASPADILYHWGGGFGTEFLVSPSTVALWHFNENTGTTAADETGSHDGVVSNATWAPGRFGSALTFGGDDRVEISDHPDFNTPELTIQAWVNASAFTSTYNCIVTKGSFPTPVDFGYALLTWDGQLAFLIGNADGSNWAVLQDAMGGTTLSEDTWHYVAVTYDGAAVRLYVDGQLDSNGTANPYAYTAGLHMANGPVDIGSSLQQTTPDTWIGRIDEVRISNVALSEAEIRNTYVLEAGRYYWYVEAEDTLANSALSATRYFDVEPPEPPPDVPVLINPPDLTLTNDNTPTFDWTTTAPVGGSYTIQLAFDAGFTTGLQTFTGLTDTTYTRALVDSTYYWRVQAFNSVGDSSGYQITPFSFTLDTQGPAVPSLINPPNASLITENTPTFDWSATAGAGGLYTLEYALDAGFTSGVVTVTGLADTTYTVPGSASLNDDTYYWHVAALDAASNSSGYQLTPFAFTVDAGAPAVPTLINPPDLTVTNNDKPTFDWSATAGPGGSYTLEYALDPAFTTGLVTVSGLTATTYTVPPLLPGGVGLLDNTYYWHVEAIDVASNASGFQATPFSVTVDTEAPDVPTLINPPDQAIVGVDRPTFDWSATAGIGGTYTLEYATDSLFLFVVTVSDLTSPTYTPTTSLANRDFYWHVSAADAAGNTSGYQAQPFMFTVDLAGLSVPILVSPPDLSFTCDTTPTFTWTAVLPATADATGNRGKMAVAGAAPAAITYTLQYGPDPLFSTATTVAGIATSTYTASDLAPVSYPTCYWRVEAVEDGSVHSGYQADPFQFGLFLAGDQNQDDAITAADIIYLVNYVFKSAAPPSPCEAVGDVNCDGAVTASDIIYLVNFTFKGGPGPCNVGDLISAGTWSCP